MTYCSEILTEFLSVANFVARGFGKRLNLKALICLLKLRAKDLTIWLLFGVWAPLSAQEFQQIEFTVYGQYPIREDIEYLPVSKEATAAGAKAETPVAIRTHSLTRIGPYSFKGGRNIAFYDTQTKELVGGVTLPSNSKKWLLIFVKNTLYEDDPENELKYKIYPFDDRIQNLPWNGLVFLNLSKMKLSGTIENQKIDLAPGESEPFRIAETMRIALRTPDLYGRKMLPAHIKNYSFQPNHRYLMILFPPVLKGSADADVRFLGESLETIQERLNLER